MANVSEIVFEIAWCDQTGSRGSEEGPGFLFDGSVQALQGGGIPVRLTGNNEVQQKRRDAGIGKVGGDSRPHGPGAEHGHTTK